MIILKCLQKYDYFRILFLKLVQNCRNVKGEMPARHAIMGYSVVR